MAKVQVSLSVSDSHVSRLKDVAQAAKKVGMKVDQQLDALGVLTGSIDQSKLAQLRRVDGVSSIEEEREVSIPKPDNPSA
jgi:hypothetical protein